MSPDVRRFERSAEGDSGAPAASHGAPTAAAPRVLNSTALFGGQSQLAIVHNETMYFLRQTRFGKLILTK